MTDRELKRNATSRERWKVFDDYAHAVTVIDEEHRIVHDGMAFFLTHHSSGLVDNGKGYILHAVGEKPAHLRACDLSVSDTPVIGRWYEGPTVSDNGTPMQAYNSNRTSDNTPTLQTYLGPTVTDPGTLIRTKYIPPAGGGVGANPAGTIASEFHEEMILKENTLYLVEVENLSGGTIDWGCEKFWYELNYPSKDTSHVQD